MYSFELRSLLARRGRAALTALAILLGVGMVAGTFVFTDTIHRAFRQLFTGETQGSEVVVGSPQGLYSPEDPPTSMPASLASRIQKLPGVGAVAGQVSGVATIVSKDGRVVKDTGSPTLAVSYLPPPFTGLRFVQGSSPVGPNEVALDQATAARTGYRIGDSVPIVTGEPSRRFKVSGIARVGSASIGGTTLAVFDPQTAQSLYSKQGLVDAIYISGSNGTTPPTLEREIRPLLPPGISAQTTREAVASDVNQVADQLQVLTGGLVAFGFIALFVGAFVIFATLSITVAQRAHELAVLRALGATRGQVLGAVVLEASTIGAVGSAAGLALGLAVALGIRALFKAVGVHVPSTGLVLEPRTVVVSVAVGMVVTIAAALPPALRATRVSPVEALRESAAPSSSVRPSPATIALAIVCVIAGVALVVIRPSSVNAQLSRSAVGAVLLVLAVVLFSPLLVRSLSRVVAWPLGRRGRILGRLALENTIRTPTRTAITASSLMIGLALVLFVSVYINGVRSSARRAVDQTFTADFAIGNRDGTSSIPAASARAVAAVPNLAAVSSVKTATASIGNTSGVTAAGIDPTTISQVYRFNWVGGSRPVLAGLGSGDVLVERDTARADQLHVGQQVKVTSPSGIAAALTVHGIYADRALLRGFALPVAAFDQLFSQDRLQQVFVKLTPGASIADASAALTQALSGLPGVVARSEHQLRNAATTRVNHVLILFYGLLAVSGLMALLGILNALTLSINERTRELGVLRAVGMTRKQVRTMVRDESLITAAIGTLIGVLLGLAVAWLVTRALSSEGVVFTVPWPQLGLLVVVALAVGVLAALPPAARAARLDVLTAIAHE